MYYADIKKTDIANGPGVRLSLFVSGCTHHCKGCFNEETWDFHYGKEFTEQTMNDFLKELEKPYYCGITLLGGEPFEHSNQIGLLPLVRKVRQLYPEKTIWCFSGYLFDRDIVETMCKKWPETKELLSYIDVLVDGEYVQDLYDISLRFRGSSNQRIIRVSDSLEKGTIVPYEFDY